MAASVSLVWFRHDLRITEYLHSARIRALAALAKLKKGPRHEH
jgi:hypothetical protein